MATVISTSRLRKEHEQFYNQTKLFECQETRIHVGIFKTSYGYETPQEIRKRVTSKVRFAGINLCKIAHKIIIKELKKIQMEKVMK